MKKMISMFLILMMMSGTAFAALVNLSKPDTSWVWRIDDGLRFSNGYLLHEDGTGFITEDSSNIRQEEPEYSYLYLESGVRMLTEDDKIILSDEYNHAHYAHNYNALRAQGWVPTDSDSNIPQGQGGSAYAVNLLLALMEDGTFFVTEASNNLRLEN